jgi:GDP-fucose protein O-fucosyltransferase
VHVRRGDFFWQRPDQDLTVGRIAYSLAQAGARSGRVYIASDEADRRFFDGLRAHYEIFFIDHFRHGPLHDMPDEHIACVEQVGCSYADVFVGTRLYL